MQPLIFDTTVWIDFLNGKKNNLTDLLSEYLDKEFPLFICPIIVQEILQGIKDDDKYLEVKKYLLSFEILFLEAVDCAIGAADLYRSLRKKGATIRKSNDCLIAHYAIEFKISIASSDIDFRHIAKYDKRLNIVH